MLHLMHIFQNPLLHKEYAFYKASCCLKYCDLGLHSLNLTPNGSDPWH